MTDADPEPREVIVHMTEAHFEHYRAWLATQPDTTIDVVGEAWADRGEFAYRVSKADEDTVRWWCDTCGRKGEVTMANAALTSVPLDLLRAEHGEPIVGHSLRTDRRRHGSPALGLRVDPLGRACACSSIGVTESCSWPSCPPMTRLAW